jgi:[NiFe] hydrogenase assembly HybE family chaperone
MPTPESIAARLEEAFVRVLEERMQGIPLLNVDLTVQAVGFHQRPDGVLGALITPWFMNLILIPPGDAPLKGLPIGMRQEIELPARKVRFTVNDLDGIGPCLTHSLFSPVNCFHSQGAAVAAAEAALAELELEAERVEMTDEEAAIERYMSKEAMFEPREVEKAMAAKDDVQEAPPRNLSRREVLFAAFRGE